MSYRPYTHSLHIYRKYAMRAFRLRFIHRSYWTCRRIRPNTNQSTQTNAHWTQNAFRVCWDGWGDGVSETSRRLDEAEWQTHFMHVGKSKDSHNSTRICKCATQWRKNIAISVSTLNYDNLHFGLYVYVAWRPRCQNGMQNAQKIFSTFSLHELICRINFESTFSQVDETRCVVCRGSVLVEH